MTIERTIYSTATLLGTMRQLQPPSNYWLNLCFPRVVQSTDEYIDFTKIGAKRRIAPLVVPTAQGKPIYSAAEKLYRVKPAYVKPKDPVTATRMIQRHAGMGELLAPNPQSPQQRYDAVVADILQTHREAIERRWEWMASQAAIYGKITLEDDAYPRVVVDFERAAGHTVTLGSGVRWGDSGVSILGNIETWRSTVRQAEFGGNTNRLTMGSAVWEVMRQDAEIRELLKLDLRQFNGGIDINLGLRNNTGDAPEVERVGSLNGTLELFVYSDYYQDYTGTSVPFMDTRDVVLTGPNVQGVRAFGAIQDTKAQFQAIPIFPKMWDQEDPSVTFIMNQSAPLMVPINPNNTFRARVLA